MILSAVAGSFEGCESTDNGRIVAKETIAMQLHETLRHILNVIERVRTIRMPSDLHTLPAGQVLIDRSTKLLDPLFQVTDGVLQILSRVFVPDGAHLFEL